MEQEKSRQEYLRRIYKVQDYIESHLDDNLELTQLAQVAGFSKYHFHRIFKSLSGESVLDYTKRIKLEKAASLLFIRQELSVTDVAHRCGFTDSGVFARTFKQVYGLSPTAYRLQDSKICTARLKQPGYNGQVPNHQVDPYDREFQKKVELKYIEPMQAAYVRYVGDYQQLQQEFAGLMSDLLAYAQTYHLIPGQNAKILTIYHDNHEFTEDDNLRSSLCLSPYSNLQLKETDKIGVLTIPGGHYAIGEFEMAFDQYPDAWHYLYSHWLSHSGYQPGDSFPFEVYLNDPNQHPEKRHHVAIYFPIEPLL